MTLCIADTEKGPTRLALTADFGDFRLRIADCSELDRKAWSQIVTEVGAGRHEAFEAPPLRISYENF